MSARAYKIQALIWVPEVECGGGSTGWRLRMAYQERGGPAVRYL